MSGSRYGRAVAARTIVLEVTNDYYYHRLPIQVESSFSSIKNEYEHVLDRLDVRFCLPKSATGQYSKHMQVWKAENILVREIRNRNKNDGEDLREKLLGTETSFPRAFASVNINSRQRVEHLISKINLQQSTEFNESSY